MRKLNKALFISAVVFMMLFSGLCVQAAEAENEVMPAEETTLNDELDQTGVYRFVVKDSLADIYRDRSDELRTDYGRIESQISNVWLAGILRGDFSPNAVAVFLDHGYFLNYYQEFLEAGLLPKGYELPENSYNISRMQERVQFPEDGDVADRYVLITDSTYLQTEQLRAISEYHGFDETAFYEELLESFETDYIPKAEW